MSFSAVIDETRFDDLHYTTARAFTARLLVGS